MIGNDLGHRPRSAPMGSRVQARACLVSEFLRARLVPEVDFAVRHLWEHVLGEVWREDLAGFGMF